MSSESKELLPDGLSALTGKLIVEALPRFGSGKIIESELAAVFDNLLDRLRAAPDSGDGYVRGVEDGRQQVLSVVAKESPEGWCFCIHTSRNALDHSVACQRKRAALIPVSTARQHASYCGLAADHEGKCLVFASPLPASPATVPVCIWGNLCTIVGCNLNHPTAQGDTLPGEGK